MNKLAEKVRTLFGFGGVARKELTLGLNLDNKKAVVASIAEQLADAQVMVVAENRGLGVAGATQLRKNARDAGVYLRVLKNTLARRAVAETPFECLTPELTGPLVYAVSDDPVAAAKVISDFARANNEKFVIRGGALRNKVLDVKSVTTLASMPSREEMLAKLLGTMQAPIAQFVRTLNEIPASFVRAVAAVRDQRAG